MSKNPAMPITVNGAYPNQLNVRMLERVPAPGPAETYPCKINR
jgi:hypothetical protein